MLIYASLMVLAFAGAMLKPREGEYDAAGYLKPASVILLPFLGYQTAMALFVEKWPIGLLAIGLAGLLLTLLHIIRVGNPRITVLSVFGAGIIALFVPAGLFQPSWHLILAMATAVIAFFIGVFTYFFKS